MSSCQYIYSSHSLLSTDRWHWNSGNCVSTGTLMVRRSSLDLQVSVLFSCRSRGWIWSGHMKKTDSIDFYFWLHSHLMFNTFHLMEVRKTIRGSDILYEEFNKIQALRWTELITFFHLLKLLIECFYMSVCTYLLYIYFEKNWEHHKYIFYSKNVFCFVIPPKIL